MTTNQITLYANTNYMNNLDKIRKVMDLPLALETLDKIQDSVSYHIRLINDNTIYPLYCDIDGLKDQLAKPLDEVIWYFEQTFQTSIKITKSETSKKNSYHVIIPMIEGTIAAQKIFWLDWNRKHHGYEVDLNVYKTTLYRLPHQLKPYDDGKKQNLILETRHYIKQGTMQDFLMQRYPDAKLLNPEIVDIVKDDIITNTMTVNNEIDNSEIGKCIQCFNKERAIDFKTWIDVGLALRNIESKEDENINYWIAFSKINPKHDSDIELAIRYGKLKKQPASKKALRIGSLKSWAKSDNEELYNQVFPKVIEKCLITEYDDEEYKFTEWEKNHCKILNPPSYMEHKVDTHAFTEQYIIRNTKSLDNSFCHKSILVPKKKKNDDSPIEMEKVSFIKTWMMKNDNIKQYDEIGIYPSPLICPPNVYNCWATFRGDLLPTADGDYSNELAAFKKLISVLCNHEEEACVYLLHWIAQAIQYPALKTTVPTIISRQGAGKGTLIKMITALLGDKKVMSTTSADVVFGKFNSLMLDAYLVNLDELSPKDVKDVEGKIKGLVTEPTLCIDIKGVSPVYVKSFHRFINTTNNEFGVFKTEIGDRRNFIVRASDELIGNKEFFTTFNKNIIENNNVVKYIYNYLKSIPGLENFHEASNIVKTSYGEALKECNRTDYDMWLENFTIRNINNNVNTFSMEYLIKDLNTFSKKEFNPNAFGIRVLNIVPNAITYGQRTSKGKTKQFNWAMLKSHYKIEECLIDETAYDNDEEI